MCVISFFKKNPPSLYFVSGFEKVIGLSDNHRLYKYIYIKELRVKSIYFEGVQNRNDDI